MIDDRGFSVGSAGSSLGNTFDSTVSLCDPGAARRLRAGVAREGEEDRGAGLRRAPYGRSLRSPVWYRTGPGGRSRGDEDASHRPARTSNRPPSPRIVGKGRRHARPALGRSLRARDWRGRVISTGLRLDRHSVRPSPVRVDRFRESIAVLKGLFADGPFNFRGTHFCITDYDGMPKPVQKPWPPILIGAGGRRMMEMAAREADIIGLLPAMGPPAETSRSTK